MIQFGEGNFLRAFVDWIIDKVFFDPTKSKLSVDEQALEQLVSRFEHYMANVASKGEQVHGLLVHVKGQLLFVFSCCWKPFLSADDFYRVESVAVGF